LTFIIRIYHDARSSECQICSEIIENIQIWLKSYKRNGHCTLRPKYVCIVLQQYEIFCISTTVKNGSHCISMATLNGFVLLTATCRSTTQRNTLLCLLGSSGYANASQYYVTHTLYCYILCINY